METVQHLILVGDHQQLQGHCSIQELENEPFHLNVSMFERLVRNEMPYKTLLQQRRMMPEFRRLIDGLYPGLSDHQSVRDRQLKPQGMGNITSFFFNHPWWEEKDQSLSTFNAEEAKFIAGFYRYLYRNGFDHSQITVLTFYNGQRKRILRELKAYPDFKPLTYINVKTVDSYQGEENNIVILSLARNNTENKIGFLANINRTCVALSRAKYGFYLFGNAQILMNNSPLWCNVVTLMESPPRRLGSALPIMCQRHKRTVLMEYPSDWEKTDGGCLSPCGERLACGHACYPYPHDSVPCKQDCEKKLSCGHGCLLKCADQCSCSCEVFARAQAQAKEAERLQSVSNEAAHKAWQTQDIRVTENGQTLPTRRSASYLPQQAPSPGTKKPSIGLERGSMQPPPWTSRSARNGRPADPNSPWNTRRLSPAAQQSLRKGWKDFAEGGHAADDQRLNRLSAQQLRQSSSASDLDQLEIRGEGLRSVPVQTQAVQILSNGRTKFTEIYRPRKPAAMNANPPAGPRSQSTPPGLEVRSQPEKGSPPKNQPYPGTNQVNSPEKQKNVIEASSALDAVTDQADMQTYGVEEDLIDLSDD
jgi:hypothetical protein